MVLVYGAESLNIYGSNNWRSFAGKNYFDKNGSFISLVWSGPLLILSLVVLVKIQKKKIERKQIVEFWTYINRCILFCFFRLI